MSPNNLVKSASLCSLAELNLSNHIVTLDQSPTYAPLTSKFETQKWTNGDDTDSLFGSNNQNDGQYSPLVLDSIEKDDEQEYYVNEHKTVDNYWDMPSDCDLIEENEALSTNQVEKLLVEDALRRIQEEIYSGKSSVDNHPNNGYWNWPSEPVLESEKKANLIASILLEESIRVMLSIDHITKMETEQVQSHNDCTRERSIPSSKYSIDYWSWNAEEEKDEVLAPHVHDPTHPYHSYWEFPSESQDPQELKNRLIEKILNEERIRNILSAEAAESREVNYHRSKKGESEAGDNFATNSQLASAPRNYWDFNSDNISTLCSEKQDIIYRILQEEKQRYILSTQNIVDNLKSNTCNDNSQAQDDSKSSDYWGW